MSLVWELSVPFWPFSWTTRTSHRLATSSIQMRLASVDHYRRQTFDCPILVRIFTSRGIIPRRSTQRAALSTMSSNAVRRFSSTTNNHSNPFWFTIRPVRTFWKMSNSRTTSSRFSPIPIEGPTVLRLNHKSISVSVSVADIKTSLNGYLGLNSIFAYHGSSQLLIFLLTALILLTIAAVSLCLCCLSKYYYHRRSYCTDLECGKHRSDSPSSVYQHFGLPSRFQMGMRMFPSYSVQVGEAKEREAWLMQSLCLGWVTVRRWKWIGIMLVSSNQMICPPRHSTCLNIEWSLPHLRHLFDHLRPKRVSPTPPSL